MRATTGRLTWVEEVILARQNLSTIGVLLDQYTDAIVGAGYKSDLVLVRTRCSYLTSEVETAATLGHGHIPTSDIRDLMEDACNLIPGER